VLSGSVISLIFSIYQRCFVKFFKFKPKINLGKYIHNMAASPLSNESISRVKDMMNLPKEELFAKLQSEPLSFFKNLKELPDEYATVVYEVWGYFDFE